MTQLVNGHRCWYDTGTPRLTGQSRLSALNPHAWRQAIRPPLPKAPAGRAGPAVRIRKTGHASRPRTTPRSISSRKNSSTRDNRGCAATATAARRCQAGSGLGPRASFTPFAPKCAGPACPAMSNAAWRGGGMGCRRWASLGSFPRTRIGVKMLVSFFDSTFGAVVHRCCARARRGIDASVPELVVG